RGILHHDDILFFSSKIINKHPFVVEVLRNKFPYFFVDEFQDSNPIQVNILKEIGDSITVVGIIGDKAQSIFEFQGADPSQFFDFDLEGIIDYRMTVNRRSTKSIISCLNNVRSDISQKAYRAEVGMAPEIIVGEDIQVFNKVNEICTDEKVYLLTRKNVTANALKKNLSSNPFTPGMLEELRTNDSNRFRSGVIVSCIKSVEFARNKNSKEAIKELERYYRKKKTKDHSKRIAIEKIMFLLENYEEYKDGTMYDFYSIIKERVNTDISALSNRGAIKPYYKSKTYQEFAVSVTINDDKSLCKTIHNAKGDEFKNVLLLLEKEEDLSFFLNNDLENNEEDRIKYVAISRAKNRLFISVPTMNDLF
ncbi:MAG: ATP-dependent helicase, partial [Candidatus Paceibacterota bacterium]